MNAEINALSGYSVYASKMNNGRCNHGDLSLCRSLTVGDHLGRFDRLICDDDDDDDGLENLVPTCKLIER